MSGTRTRGSPLRDYLELVRLPNLFTAMADVAMGMLLVWSDEPVDTFILGLLMTASVLLYAAGVVLNDVFDYQVDLVERPWRPLPSGRISRAMARHIGWQLLLAGLLPGWFVILRTGTFRTGAVAVGLAACIVLYDALLKRTPLGPLAMGGCRMLNVMLGMSVSPLPWAGYHWLVAAAIGLYVTGVTWLARTEARKSHRGHLAAATLVILAGIALLSCFPLCAENLSPLLQRQPFRWPLLMSILGLVIGRHCLKAVIHPGPAQVQLAVRQCILSLVILDASVVFAVRQMHEAILVVLLLAPALVFGRWIGST